MKKLRVGVMRGGPSSEYEVSLKTGESVLKHLPRHYTGVDIFVDKKGVWHIGGVEVKPKDLLKKVDVVFNALHGEYGEDGKVQRILETFHIPFTGSGSLASALGINKILAQKIFKQHGLKIPHHKVIKKADYDKHLASELFKTFPQPSVIKPADRGSSVGVSIVHTIKEIEEGLKKAFEVSEKVIIEECIKGKEATCGVLEHFRGKSLYALLPIEIIPQKDQKFFDYEAKYSESKGASEICPGNFSKDESRTLQEMAEAAHKAIGARHYSRSDFIVHPKRGIYILEINTLPGMTAQSLLPKEMAAIGSSFEDLLGHLIDLTLKK